MLEHDCASSAEAADMSYILHSQHQVRTVVAHCCPSVLCKSALQHIAAYTN